MRQFLVYVLSVGIGVIIANWIGMWLLRRSVVDEAEALTRYASRTE